MTTGGRKNGGNFVFLEHRMEPGADLLSPLRASAIRHTEELEAFMHFILPSLPIEAEIAFDYGLMIMPGSWLAEHTAQRKIRQVVYAAGRH